MSAWRIGADTRRPKPEKKERKDGFWKQFWAAFTHSTPAYCTCPKCPGEH